MATKGREKDDFDEVDLSEWTCLAGFF